ncbi:hypothetical protein GOV14_06660 [Candidatus Pacearchaeota archaeon]|nr:hypothetical protein [Candidatus Pacearchaeota archaeon]
MSMIKFMVGISSLIPTSLLAIFKLSGGEIGPFYWLLQGVVFLVTFFALLIVFLYLVQTRLYFVYPTRQLNAIRKYYLEKDKQDFEYNQMYTNYRFSAFKWMSTHTFIIFGVSIISTVFWIGGVLSLATYFGVESKWGVSLISGFILLVLSNFLAGRYLKNKSRLAADDAVHGSK